MFRGPRDYNKLDLKKFTGHKDEVSIFESKKKAYNDMINDHNIHFVYHSSHTNLKL